MIERNKITISFLPSDGDLWDFLLSKKQTCNISEYIRNLIRQDMNKSSSFIEEEEILDRILQALQKTQMVTPEKDSVTIESRINEETKNTINSLF